MIDFLGIGAQKAGTSWLMANLSSHPDVWTPFVKEVHYFDVVHVGIKSRKRHLDGLLIRARRILRKDKGKGELAAAGRRYLRRVVDPDFAFTDEWYSHIFSPAGPDRVKGEFTPAYCMIGPAGADHVKRIAPRVRLIYLIRDPVDRALSSIRMAIHRDPQTNIAAATKSPSFLSRGDYASYIPVWDAAFPAGQVLYLPFGRVRSDPGGVLGAVERHLGLAPFKGYPLLGEAVHASKARQPIPGEVVEQIRRSVEPQYAFLERRFDKSFVLEIK